MAREIDAQTWDREVIKSDKPVIVDFWHNQCPWCLKLNPIYDKLSEEYTRATLVKLDILSSEENGQIANKHGVMGTPTLIIFCEGREVGELVGFMEKDVISTEVDRILDRASSCVKQSSVLGNIQGYFQKLRSASGS